jgi:hypothetical protein
MLCWLVGGEFLYVQSVMLSAGCRRLRSGDDLLRLSSPRKNGFLFPAHYALAAFRKRREIEREKQAPILLRGCFDLAKYFMPKPTETLLNWTCLQVPILARPEESGNDAMDRYRTQENTLVSKTVTLHSG